jgi:[glutamine synthetase] adenylyltransferase / [glutamine synthetase]-adenylyl-L-tyrosine phosphorylase
MAPLPPETPVTRGCQQWLEAASARKDELSGWMQATVDPKSDAYPYLEAVFAHSPYLTRLLVLYPGLLHRLVTQGADVALASLMRELAGEQQADEDVPVLMKRLRLAKNRLALLVALADIGGLWPLEKVTAALSSFADSSVAQTLDTLLAIAHRRGEIALADPKSPSAGSGLIILGMGKLGGGELNYSSDIDLIVFFEAGKIPYKGRHNEQHFMNRLAQDLVNVMQERTGDGYVFRTDLRLRPDPASTPAAINTDAAYFYYESVGQNWERAAMIKARPIAGDIPAGERFLKNLSPYMWRRSLDFASIQDIHSIKRQMDSRQGRDIGLKGHNIKLGVGGIREIEFYAQIHQLIWGGREPSLRIRSTCDALKQLAALGLITAETSRTMLDSYRLLRTLEHRLQMVADEQTHTLPQDDGALERIAGFMDFPDIDAFAREVLGRLHAVHDVFSSSFKGAEKLGDEGNLVFTGVSHDPETLATLGAMGYQHPETVSEIVMGWHHGSRRATRSTRAREVLTELMPVLLKRLAETANPDAALLRFHDFLANMPSGVQIFSLFQANPQILGLIADILGSAPTLADHLSKSPHLLDVVLQADFYGPLPTKAQLAAQLDNALSLARDFEERMDALRQFRNERQFQAGVHLLKGMVTAHQAGAMLSDLADLMVAETLDAVTQEFRRSHGVIEGAQFAVIALGKLGSREMTFSSDIDLVFVYDAPDMERFSDGEKSFTASVYYNRLAQRLPGALSAMGRDGRLYEVDTRLRPSGTHGLLATSLAAFTQYFDTAAWTFEFMAFTKARVACGDSPLAKTLDAFITGLLARKHDPAKLKADAIDMRERIDKEHGTKDIWDIKYVRGGLIDLDFIAQYLLLKHAAADARPGSAVDIITWLRDHKILSDKIAAELLAGEQFLSQVFNRLRLCSDKGFNEAYAPPGFKKLLCEAVGAPDFETLKTRLIDIEQRIYGHYIALVAT